MARNRTWMLWVGAVALALVGLVLLGRSFLGGGDPAFAVGASRGGGAESRSEVVLEGGGGSGAGNRVPRSAAPAPEEEARASLPPAPDDLRAQLRRVAKAEQAVFAAGGGSEGAAGDELEGDLEAALAPLLFHPETMPRILDLLRSGELRVRLDHLDGEERELQEGRLGLEEFGALRTLYWAILTYNASYGVVQEAGIAVDGEALLMDVLLALPDLEDPVRGELLTLLTEARLDGVLVLGAEHLGEILRLRAMFPAHESVFSALLVAMGEGMTPEERTAFFRVFLPETDDPVLMGVTLRNLLQGADPEFALWMAGERFDDAGATPEMQAAIASAVVDGSEDPFRAVEFLTERAEVTAGMPALYLSLGWKGEEAQTALDSKYSALAADGADPEARRLLVLGMGGAPRERLLEIARDDTDPGVRGQALITATSAGDREPTWEEVETLRNAYTGVENGIGAASAVAVASNLARRARAGGHEDLKREAVSFLVNLAEDRGLSAGMRRNALDELKGYLDEFRWAELAEEISKRN